MLGTLLHPDAGRARVGDDDEARESASVRGVSGPVPQALAIYPTLTLSGHIDDVVDAIESNLRKIRGKATVRLAHVTR